MTDLVTDTIATSRDRTPAAIEEPAPPRSGRPDRLRLLALSFLMLFVELALIRWTGSNNEYLASLTNFVLMASFLGIGIGFLRRAGTPPPGGVIGRSERPGE